MVAVGIRPNQPELVVHPTAAEHSPHDVAAVRSLLNGIEMVRIVVISEGSAPEAVSAGIRFHQPSIGTILAASGESRHDVTAV